MVDSDVLCRVPLVFSLSTLLGCSCTHLLYLAVHLLPGKVGAGVDATYNPLTPAPTALLLIPLLVVELLRGVSMTFALSEAMAT